MISDAFFSNLKVFMSPALFSVGRAFHTRLRPHQMHDWPAMLVGIVVVASMLACPPTVSAQFVAQAVGGISVDPAGVLSNSERDTNGLRQFWLDNIQPVPGELKRATPLRKVSLRGLAAKLQELGREERRAPDDVRFLAGLQRVEYVLVYPEQQDIVLVGFGEGWVVDRRGFVVGATTGRPVLQLDDLLVALRTADEALARGLTCSIDPTEEGLARLNKTVAQFQTLGLEPKEVAALMERELGPQRISFGGLSPDTRFAHVMLAADYRMKRLGMNLDRSPVKGLPSYLQLVKGKVRGGIQNLLPRWWLTTNYDALLTDGNGLAWQLRGQGVKCMTEDDWLAADGTRQHTGKSSPAAKKWAEQMTKKYDELSAKEPIFGELRNCIDLAVVAAIIVKEKLPERAGLDLGALVDASQFATEIYPTPKQVPTQASVLETTDAFILSASGGVQVDSRAVAEHQQPSDKLAPILDTAAAGRGEIWWWN
jgi:hypothetical protein